MLSCSLGQVRDWIGKKKLKLNPVLVVGLYSDLGSCEILVLDSSHKSNRYARRDPSSWDGAQ